jgi:hypothetical protein
MARWLRGSVYPDSERGSAFDLPVAMAMGEFGLAYLSLIAILTTIALAFNKM